VALKLRRAARDEALHLFSARCSSVELPHIWQSLLTPTASFKALTGLQVEEFPFYNPSMPNQNPLAGVVPQVIHPRIAGETTITEYIEKIEGEVALDSYVKAQTSAPEVVKRISELENCLQRLANAALASGNIAKHPDLRAAAEEAKLLLKNRLEVDDTRHRFHSELGLAKDESRIIED
jgi:hypothetical protein